MIIAPISALGVFADRAETWEAASCDALVRLLRPHDIVVEGGTGTGKTTLIAARLARLVFSFDPHPEVARWVLGSSLPRNVIYRPVALISHGRRTMFWACSEFWNSSTVLDGEFVHGRLVGEHWVQAVAARDAVDTVGATVFVMDTEGEEARTISTLWDCATLRLMVIEFHPLLNSPPPPLPGKGWEIESITPEGEALVVVYKRKTTGAS